MKCPNCGAEINNSNGQCNFCGTNVPTQSKSSNLSRVSCPNCKSYSIVFNADKKNIYKNNKGSTMYSKIEGLCGDCGYTWVVSSHSNQAAPKKSSLWLWVLGWIIIFPVPLTILIIRKEDMKASIKFTIIAITWIVYFIMAAIGKADKDTISPTTGTVSIEQEIENTTPISDMIEVYLEVTPHINTADGTVVFEIISNLPMDTELMVTVKNPEGYIAQDKTIILSNGYGRTSEFSDHGIALNGHYTVTVSMSLPNLQSDSVRAVIGEYGEFIYGQYVQKAAIRDYNYISGDFEFDF